MSQNTITLNCNQGGTTYTDNLNLALSAVDSLHSGATAPTTNVVDGKLWLDTSSADNIIKVKIGSTGGVANDGWHSLFDFDGTNFFAEQAETATTATLATDAVTWQTPRTIALTGAITGTSGNFDGSANLSFATTLQNHSASLLTSGTVSNDSFTVSYQYNLFGNFWYNFIYRKYLNCWEYYSWWKYHSYWRCYSFLR